jgi:hypothetical protein
MQGAGTTKILDPERGTGASPDRAMALFEDIVKMRPLRILMVVSRSPLMSSNITITRYAPSRRIVICIPNLISDDLKPSKLHYHTTRIGHRNRRADRRIYQVVPTPVLRTSCSACMQRVISRRHTCSCCPGASVASTYLHDRLQRLQPDVLVIIVRFTDNRLEFANRYVSRHSACHRRARTGPHAAGFISGVHSEVRLHVARAPLIHDRTDKELYQ